MDDVEAGKEVEDTIPRIHGMSISRLEQLRRDMLLTPEERVRAAEETLKLDRLRAPAIPQRAIGFDRYEDYLDYKWKSSAGGA